MDQDTPFDGVTFYVRGKKQAVLSRTFIALICVGTGVQAAGGGTSGLRKPLTSTLVHLGKAALEAGDPGAAFAAWRSLNLRAVAQPELLDEAELGLGRTWLMIGKTDIALGYARQVLGREARSAGGYALLVRALLRKGDFPGALRQARRGAELGLLRNLGFRAAHASALYRNQKLQEARKEYVILLKQNPLHPEALVRMGTGLIEPRPAPAAPSLRRAVALQRAGAFDQALQTVQAFLQKDPRHPTALRLAGEWIFEGFRLRGPLLAGDRLPQAWILLDDRRPKGDTLSRFFPGYAKLSPERQMQVRVSLRPFAEELPILLARGGRHDILGEWERTTDAKDRAWLRGQKTFDGRVWDDVRGMGGLRAATGVEALDEAREGGFQTLVHELAHQVHLYLFSAKERREIRSLYEDAKRNHRCLDYYAAANEAEYFAQGVEAWVSLWKAAGQPVTHGHTRFELARRDPALFRWIERRLGPSPLRGSKGPVFAKTAFDFALQTAHLDDAKALLPQLPARARPASSRALRQATLVFRGL